jgi:hypothetical protein
MPSTSKTLPVRALPFGPGGEGLVTFLVYEPDELVLVTRVQWLRCERVSEGARRLQEIFVKIS